MPSARSRRMIAAARPGGRSWSLDYDHTRARWTRPPASWTRFYAAFLDWRAAGRLDNAAHRAPAPGLRGRRAQRMPRVVPHVTAVSAGEADFFRVAGMWRLAADSRGRQMVAAGHLERGRARGPPSPTTPTGCSRPRPPLTAPRGLRDRPPGPPRGRPGHDGPDGSRHLRHLLEPARRRGQRAGGGAAAHVLHLHRARGGRPLRRRLRPARLDARPGGDGHAGPYQLDGALPAPHARRHPGGDAAAGRRPHHQRPVEGLGTSQRRHHRHARLPRRRLRRPLRLHLPYRRHRRPYPLRGGARGLRGGPLHPHHEALRRGAPRSRARRAHPRQCPPARAGDGRLPRPDRGRRRGRRAAARVHGRVRPRAARAARRRDRGPHRAGDAGVDRAAPPRRLHLRADLRRLRRAHHHPGALRGAG